MANTLARVSRGPVPTMRTKQSMEQRTPRRRSASARDARSYIEISAYGSRIRISNGAAIASAVIVSVAVGAGIYKRLTR